MTAPATPIERALCCGSRCLRPGDGCCAAHLGRGIALRLADAGYAVIETAELACLRQEHESMALQISYAAGVFERYAALHAAKGTPEAAIKSRANKDIARTLLAALPEQFQITMPDA